MESSYAILSQALAWVIRWSGLAWLIRNTWARGRVSILLYHDPDPELVERHLAYLGRRYSLVPLGTLVEALRSGEWGSLPARPLVITIDDGHASNFALTDVFERHGARPTIFICSQIVGTSRHFWFLDCDDAEAESLKAVDNQERLSHLERAYGFTQEREYGPQRRQALSAEEVRTMGRGCDFESHGRFHPILPRCPDAVAAAEVGPSRAEVEELTGRPCRHFAYPLGAYSRREVDLVKASGYESARTADIGWNGRRADPHRLKILSVADGLTETKLAAELSGVKRFIRLLRREGRLDGSFRPRWDRELGIRRGR